MFRGEIRSRRLKDLVAESRGIVDEAPPNYRLLVLDAIRAELSAMRSEIERGQFEDRGMGRLALARSVALLIEIDRDYYREERKCPLMPFRALSGE